MRKRVLVGDDQFGVEGSDLNDVFRMNYGEVADFDFTADPESFIERARSGRYDALMIDLKWEPDDAIREDKTGYRVLAATREYAPIRVLWTSESSEARERGVHYGATHMIAKGVHPERLENILYDSH